MNSLSVLLNRGDGSFPAGRDYPTGGGPVSVAIGDLNGDQKPDLATANADATSVSVLLNTGNGGFGAKQDYETESSPGSVAPKVIRMTVAAAKRAIARADCRVGTIGRAYSRTVKTGRVISQRPRPGMVLRKGGKVTLIVSRGRKR